MLVEDAIAEGGWVKLALEIWQNDKRPGLPFEHFPWQLRVPNYTTKRRNR
jgi:hypothetical protein